ncbi:hypothetical protein T06_8202 [Trichinella sp. T6]|nr:hypothetical protein T06_8202 [Trichinella sp. T6]
MRNSRTSKIPIMPVDEMERQRRCHSGFQSLNTSPNWLSAAILTVAKEARENQNAGDCAKIQHIRNGTVHGTREISSACKTLNTLCGCCVCICKS